MHACHTHTVRARPKNQPPSPHNTPRTSPHTHTHSPHIPPHAHTRSHCVRHTAPHAPHSRQALPPATSAKLAPHLEQVVVLAHVEQPGMLQAGVRFKRSAVVVVVGGARRGGCSAIVWRRRRRRAVLTHTHLAAMSPPPQACFNERTTSCLSRFQRRRQCERKHQGGSAPAPRASRGHLDLNPKCAFNSRLLNAGLLLRTASAAYETAFFKNYALWISNPLYVFYEPNRNRCFFVCGCQPGVTQPYSSPSLRNHAWKEGLKERKSNLKCVVCNGALPATPQTRPSQKCSALPTSHQGMPFLRARDITTRNCAPRPNVFMSHDHHKSSPHQLEPAAACARTHKTTPTTIMAARGGR